MRRRFALDAPRLVDDAFEQAPHGRDLQRSGRGLLDVLEDLLLAVGRVDREAEDAFELADLDGVFGALVEQAHEDFVDAIDGVAEADQISFSIVSVDHKKTSSPSPGRGVDGRCCRAPLRGGALHEAPGSVEVVAVPEGAVTHWTGGYHSFMRMTAFWPRWRSDHCSDRSTRISPSPLASGCRALPMIVPG